jgi:hypothetical protein
MAFSFAVLPGLNKLAEKHYQSRVRASEAAEKPGLSEEYGLYRLRKNPSF